MSVDGVSYWDGKRWKQSPDARERVRRAQAFVDRANQEPYNRVALYEAALNHHSHNLTALDGLIEAYSDSSRSHEVAELCRRYLQVAWSDTVVRHLAFAYAELGQFDDAIAAATRLLETSD